jgi:hypothetical protein
MLEAELSSEARGYCVNEPQTLGEARSGHERIQCRSPSRPSPHQSGIASPEGQYRQYLALAREASPTSDSVEMENLYQ